MKEKRYPAPTPESFADFEKATGYPLPGCLRRIYETYGNGGFGPYSDMLGLIDGHKDDLGRDIHTIYNDYMTSDPEDTAWCWPEYMIPFLHLGCAMYLCYDAREAPYPIYRFDPSRRGIGDDMAPAFTLECASLESWLKDNVTS